MYYPRHYYDDIDLEDLAIEENEVIQGTQDIQEEEDLSDYDDDEYTISDFDEHLSYQDLQDNDNTEDDEEEEETEQFIVIYTMVPIRGASYFTPSSGAHTICILLNFIKQPFKELKIPMCQVSLPTPFRQSSFLGPIKSK